MDEAAHCCSLGPLSIPGLASNSEPVGLVPAGLHKIHTNGSVARLASKADGSHNVGALTKQQPPARRTGPVAASTHEANLAILCEAAVKPTRRRCVGARSPRVDAPVPAFDFPAGCARAWAANAGRRRMLCRRGG